MYYVLSVVTKLGRKIVLCSHQGGLVKTAPQVQYKGLVLALQRHVPHPLPDP